MESWCAQADSTAAGTDRCTFLAFSDDSPVGIAAIHRSKSDNEEGEILQVWLSPEYRGSSVARELLHALTQWCAANGIRRVLAAVARDNTRALSFEKDGLDTERPASSRAFGIFVKDIKGTQ